MPNFMQIVLFLSMKNFATGRISYLTFNYLNLLTFFVLMILIVFSCFFDVFSNTVDVPSFDGKEFFITIFKNTAKKIEKLYTDKKLSHYILTLFYI